MLSNCPSVFGGFLSRSDRSQIVNVLSCPSYNEKLKLMSQAYIFNLAWNHAAATNHKIELITPEPWTHHPFAMEETQHLDSQPLHLLNLVYISTIKQMVDYLIELFNKEITVLPQTLIFHNIDHYVRQMKGSSHMSIKKLSCFIDQLQSHMQSRLNHRVPMMVTCSDDLPDHLSFYNQCFGPVHLFKEEAGAVSLSSVFDKSQPEFHVTIGGRPPRLIFTLKARSDTVVDQ